jgi:predicted Rdx family selenoprotein
VEQELLDGLEDVEVELDKGSGGIFKIWKDDELIYDKEDTHRFPDENEILEDVKVACHQKYRGSEK